MPSSASVKSPERRNEMIKLASLIQKNSERPPWAGFWGKRDKQGLQGENGKKQNKQPVLESVEGRN